MKRWCTCVCMCVAQNAPCMYIFTFCVMGLLRLRHVSFSIQEHTNGTKPIIYVLVFLRFTLDLFLLPTRIPCHIYAAVK